MADIEKEFTINPFGEKDDLEFAATRMILGIIQEMFPELNQNSAFNQTDINELILEGLLEDKCNLGKNQAVPSITPNGNFFRFSFN